MTQKPRLPAGQRQASSWVAMPPIRWDYPNVKKEDWRLKIHGLVENEKYYNWDEFNTLEQKDYTIDFHCVTRWSRLDQAFTGVNFKTILDLVKPTEKAKFVIFESDDGYTTNLNLDELKTFDDVIIATKMDDASIPFKFGGPVRVVVPQLYGWKSAKFLCGIKFSDHDEPGYWETKGYHNHGNPWSEERYS
jgi:DMSO/TMAO reductase YedYZ molybdopterin-dependent catalytic subunit